MHRQSGFCLFACLFVFIFLMFLGVESGLLHEVTLTEKNEVSAYSEKRKKVPAGIEICHKTSKITCLLCYIID